MVIDILDWNITHTDLMQWVAETGAKLDAISRAGWFAGGPPSTKYKFRDEEDFIMFKLAFQKKEIIYRVGYIGKQIIDSAAYYAPHIPTLNEKSNN